MRNRLFMRAFCIAVCIVVQLVVAAYAGAAQVQAPGFELSDLEGKTHRLSDYRGKVVILNFWASWCPECITEMPSLNALYEKFRGNGLVVLGIAADRKKEPAEKVIKKTGVTYPLLLEQTGGVFVRQYTVIALPTTVVIDKNGFIADRIIGSTDFDSQSFVKKVQALLDSGAGK
ncbi:MAG: TlpA family protein disulfide reductase [Chloroflexota bacterium]